MPIVWTKPDGSVQIMRLSPRFLEEHRGEEETTLDAVTRLAVGEQAKTPGLDDATFTVMSASAIPAERSQRNKWRLRDGRVIVDETVPDPPHPKQALLDAISGAKDLDTLKAELLEGIRRGKL